MTDHLGAAFMACNALAVGKPLGVRCPDCASCHADVLLEVANGPLMCEAANV